MGDSHTSHQPKLENSEVDAVALGTRVQVVPGALAAEGRTSA